LGTLLDNIEYPSDLKKIEIEQLSQVCAEVRDFIIDQTSKNPGHFGASLGVVELTVALHYALNTPYDRIVWDVGHQAYAHKILTGRRKVFHTNRKKDGICGFPNPVESEYDSFLVGHSSTSISAALGMAVAAHKKGEHDRQIVAVIGDGSLTGGLAFEGLNNAGIQKSNLLVIVNDNNMAIDANVGAINQYLIDITTSQAYNKLKDDVWKFLGKLSRFGPNARSLAQKIDNGLKSIILKESNLFESLNFRYFGPVDGHDVLFLVKLIEDLKKIQGPKVLHIRTQKGKGFKYAEQNQTKWHAPGIFDAKTGEILKSDSKNKPPKYQDVFGYTLFELAEKDERVVGVTPAMVSGCSMNILHKKMPERVFDVGIAEQHAVTFAAGMCKDGLRPFCNIYSSFMQRAYDQVIHDVAIQKLPVVICLDRAGLVGADGATHQGLFDIAYMRTIPNVVVSAPINEHQLRNLMFTAYTQTDFPFVIRYPRGNGVLVDWKNELTQIPLGKGEIICEGDDILVLSIGHIGNHVIEACSYLKSQGYNIGHYNMVFVKPIDTELLTRAFAKYKKIITIEDGLLNGGFGSAVLEYMSDSNCDVKVKRLGVDDNFVEHATPEEQYKQCGIDKDGIVEAIFSLL
jgi:1-deoxy-D-xylulose-5-phosphate synthase